MGLGRRYDVAIGRCLYLQAVYLALRMPARDQGRQWPNAAVRAEACRAGRSLRSTPDGQDLCAAKVAAYVHGSKTDFAGIGPDALRQFPVLAQLIANSGARPYFR